MDWNGDGILDLIHGNRWDGNRLYTGNGDGTLHLVGHVFDDEGVEIRTRYNTSPWLVDWNGDGLLDLLLAGYPIDMVYGGILRIYGGIGDQSDTLLFDADYQDFTWFYNQRRTTAQTSDLDGDGDLDIILGYETGEVYFAENIGSADEPVFGSYSVMQCDAGPIDVYSRFPGSGRARPNVCDYDADGTPDLLVGCQSGWIYVFRGYRAETPHDLSLVVPERMSEGTFLFDLVTPDGLGADVTVTGMTGEVVASMPGRAGGAGSWDLSGAPPGIYAAEAVLGDTSVVVPILRL